MVPLSAMPRTARERERRGGSNRQRSDTQESLQAGATRVAGRRLGAGGSVLPCSRPDPCASAADTAIPRRAHGATSSKGDAGTVAGGAWARGNCTCRACALRRAAPLPRPPPSRRLVQRPVQNSCSLKFYFDSFCSEEDFALAFEVAGPILAEHGAHQRPSDSRHLLAVQVETCARAMRPESARS